MLTYKMNSAGVSPTLVIPKVGGVDNPAVDIFIDTEERTTRLYVAYISPCGQIIKPFIFNWLQHDCGVLPEYFADQAQDMDSTKALQAGISGAGLATAINESNNASLRDYYARQVTAAQSRSPSLFSSVLGTVAAPLTGSTGLLSGGFFSSLFGRR